MKIRFMQQKDLPQIIAIHIDRFSTSRSGIMGKAFLKRLYQWFLIHNPELSLVATDEQDCVLGFFVASKGPYTPKVFRYALPGIILSFIANPSRLLRKDIFQNARSFLKSLVFRKRAEQEHDKGFEPGDEDRTIYYASLAVARAHEGIGVPLMFALEAEAKKNPDRNILSSWVANENDSLIKTYLAFGWRIVFTTPQSVRLAKTVR